MATLIVRLGQHDYWSSVTLITKYLRVASRVSAFGLFSAWICGPGAAQTPTHAPRASVFGVTQLASNLPQFQKVDIPLLRDAIHAASAGRVTVILKAYPEANLQPADALRLARSGQIDFIGTPLSTVAGDVPLLDGFDLPGGYQGFHDVRRAAVALTPIANHALERMGLRLVATSPFPAQVFFCRRALSGLEDLKLRKIRTSGPAQAEFVSALGAQPVALAIGEVYSALELGTVDCAISGTGIANAQRWNEVTTHMYTLRTQYAVMGYVVNLTWWNRLEPSIRGLFESAFRRVEDAQWALGEGLTDDGIYCNIGDAERCKVFTVVRTRPMTWVRPSQGDVIRSREIFANIVLPNWVKRCGARCGEIYNAVVAPISGIPFAAR